MCPLSLAISMVYFSDISDISRKGFWGAQYPRSCTIHRAELLKLRLY